MSADGTGSQTKALQHFLERREPVIRTWLEKVEGSAPRTQGTAMLVAAHSIHGTIGGGFAEFETIAHARMMLETGGSSDQRTIILGPDSGQCCGGRLTIRFERLTPAMADGMIIETREAERANRTVMLFGAGHVGKALAQALSPLPFRTIVVETRVEELEGLPTDVTAVAAALPESLISTLPPESAVVILTHDHALDFLIAREALVRPDLAYIGMIGSATKRASFAGQWKRDGGDPLLLNRLVLPIGGNLVKDKRPAVIAALVAAELLMLPPLR